MATAITVQSLLNRFYLGLNEDANTTITELASGDGSTGANTLTAEQGAVRLLNDAKDWAWRSVFAAQTTFLVTFLANNWNRRYDLMTPGSDGTPGDTVTTGAKLWWPRLVAIGGIELTYTGESYLRARDSAYHLPFNATTHSQVGTLNPTTGAWTAKTPAEWYRQGENALGLYAVPVVDTAVTVNGLYIPGDMVAPTGVMPPPTIDWCEPAQVEVILLKARLDAINKARQNPDLVAREADIRMRLDKMAAVYWGALESSLRDPRNGPYKMPPVQVQSK